MTTTSRDGRNLIIEVPEIDPFTIRPIPAKRATELTERFLRVSVAGNRDASMDEVLAWALDGLGDDGEWIVEGPNWLRLQEQLTLSEAEDVHMCAFLWNTVLGDRGPQLYLEAGGGILGGVRAMGALAARVLVRPQVGSEAVSA